MSLPEPVASEPPNRRRDGPYRHLADLEWEERPFETGSQYHASTGNLCGLLMTHTAGRPRTLVLGVKGLKAVIAVVFIAHPRAIEAWVGPTANQPGGHVLLRAFGVHDLSLAIGAIRAGSAVERRRWLVAGGTCDLLDAAATVATARTRRRGLGPMAMITGTWAALSGIACLASRSRNRSRTTKDTARTLRTTSAQNVPLQLALANGTRDA